MWVYSRGVTCKNNLLDGSLFKGGLFGGGGLFNTLLTYLLSILLPGIHAVNLAIVHL